MGCLTSQLNRNTGAIVAYVPSSGPLQRRGYEGKVVATYNHVGREWVVTPQIAEIVPLGSGVATFLRTFLECRPPSVWCTIPDDTCKSMAAQGSKPAFHQFELSTDAFGSKLACVWAQGNSNYINQYFARSISLTETGPLGAFVKTVHDNNGKNSHKELDLRPLCRWGKGKWLGYVKNHAKKLDYGLVEIRKCNTTQRRLMVELGEHHHTNVVRVLAFHAGDQNVEDAMTTPWYSGGHLGGGDAVRRFSGRNLFHILAGAFDGLRYLNNEGLVHGRIHPAAILVHMPSAGLPIGVPGVVLILRDDGPECRSTTRSRSPPRRVRSTTRRRRARPSTATSGRSCSARWACSPVVTGARTPADEIRTTPSRVSSPPGRTCPAS